MTFFKNIGYFQIVVGELESEQGSLNAQVYSDIFSKKKKKEKTNKVGLLINYISI